MVTWKLKNLSIYRQNIAQFVAYHWSGLQINEYENQAGINVTQLFGFNRDTKYSKHINIISLYFADL